MLRIVSTALEDALRRRWSRARGGAAGAARRTVAARASRALADLREALAALAALAGRLWLPPSLAARTARQPPHTLAVLVALLARLAAGARGFAALPVDEALPHGRLNRSHSAPMSREAVDEPYDRLAALPRGCGCRPW